MLRINEIVFKKQLLTDLTHLVITLCLRDFVANKLVRN